MALYGEFYQGLAEPIKDQLLSLDCSQMFQQPKANALKCDTCYWEHQGEKAAPSGWARQSAFTTAPAKLGNLPNDCSVHACMCVDPIKSHSGEYICHECWHCPILPLGKGISLLV